MTIQEYWDKNKNSEWHTGIGKDEKMLWFAVGKYDFICWIDEGVVWISGHDESIKYQLKHIKTIDQYKQLCKLLLGEELLI